MESLPATNRYHHLPKNNHMLDEQLNTTFSCVLQTDRRAHFSKDLLSLFFQEISGTQSMVTRTHIL